MFPRITLLLCLFVAALLPAASRAAEQPPNIVIILADDLGINDLSCYGRKDLPTPNIDKLASQSVRFTSSYAQPICSPTRAELLTGKNPARLHLTNFLPGRADARSQKLLQPIIEGQLPLEELTVADVLKSAGYATACIGKWHLGGKGFGPEKRGFDFVFAGHANTKPTDEEGSKGEYELTTQASQWMEQHKAGPFFLYLAHNTPHIPYAARPEDIAKHAGAFNPTYASVIERMDDVIGKTLAKLDELDLTQNTIVFFAGDNGGLHVLEYPDTPATHNTPFRAGKGYLYEGGVRVPLIVRWPGHVKPGTVSDTPVSLRDLTPTLIEAAGLTVAKTLGPVDSVSLTGLLNGGELASRQLFWHMPNYTNQGGRPSGAVRDGDWKLVENYEDGSVELYNLASDPGEKKDLAKTDPSRAESLKTALDSWRQKMGAQECVPNPDFDAALHKVLYEDRDPSKIEGANTTAAEIEKEWKSWREAMNAAVKGRTPRVTAATGDIRLLAKEATVHAVNARYEPQTYKNTIGYWTKPDDWVSWDFDVVKAGKYEVEVLQGCGAGGGSEIAVEVGGQTLRFTVQDTGHFQNFIARTIGTVELPAGHQTLAVKPRTKVGGAIMDLRRVVLREVPITKSE